jgi:hypothetical protein
MRRLLVGAALVVAGCRQDAGLAPSSDGRSMRSTAAQCLAPTRAGTTGAPTDVRSRLATALLGRSEVVCLAEEGGRWHLRPARSLAE